MIKKLKNIVKGILDDPNDTDYMVVGGQWLSFHDRTHLEVARLERVEILGQRVSGIHGVSVPEFGREGLPAEYDGLLDECRVGLHQWVTLPTKPIFIIRALYWFFWLASQSENPVRVLRDHIRTV